MSNGSGVVAGFLAAIVVGGGIALAGKFVADGIVENRTADRYVTVKGLAEREVQADLAVWPITIVASGDDLQGVQSDIDADIAALTGFLREAGFSEAEVSLDRIQVEDRVAAGYHDPSRQQSRYTIRQPVIVRADQVDLVAETSRRLGEVVRQGVVMQDWQGPSFLFTRLNDVKPDMIAEATAAAREAAQQFADDAGADIGELRTANQGVFVILPRDEFPGAMESQQVFKTVRVVTTVTYALD